MREIKFARWEKTWDRKWKQEIEHCTLMEIRQDNEFNDYEDYYWMRYTGVEDKNNTEIYEDYIVKDKRGNIGIVKIGECKDMTINGEYSLKYNGVYVDFIQSECFGYNKDIEDRYLDNSFEVIGHKYKNKELLEEN